MQLTSGVGVFAHVCEQTLDTLSTCCDNLTKLTYRHAFGWHPFLITVYMRSALYIRPTILLSVD